MNFVFCFADRANEWNTSSWRAHIPANGINTHKEHWAKCIPLTDFASYGNPTVQSICGKADVILVQRNLLSAEIWEACDYWRGLGKTLVADLDDDYPHLTPQNPAYPFWIEDRLGMKEQTGKTPIELLTEGFRHVDALVSPNRKILQHWSDIVPGYWLPNYAYGEWYKDIEQKPLDESEIIIGWGGSVSHWDGWWFSGIIPALQNVLSSYPQVKLKLCGNDERVKRLFAERFPEDRWFHQTGVLPNEWPKQVASFDIGLAPLCGPGAEQSESYDQHRSWLKALEYALCGVPWVGSEGGVYEELEEHTVGWCVENTAGAWERALVNLLEGLVVFKEHAQRRMAWAHDNLIMENVVGEYVKVFQTIVSERSARQGARLPNVFYARDMFEQFEGVTPQMATSPDLDLDKLVEYQLATFELSRNWYGGLDLDFAGVDLGDCLQYPFLHTLNTQLFSEVCNG